VDFKLIKSLDELKTYEREQYYRGHEESWIDIMSGSSLPNDDEYPAFICTTETGDTYDGTHCFFRVIITPQIAHRLLWEKDIMINGGSFKV
jgi:hypothetical protein